MMRTDIHAEFAGKFGFPRLEPARPVNMDVLHAVEEELKAVFPASYLSFMRAHGPLFTPDILHLAVTAHEASGTPEVEIFDVREFFQPHEIVETYRGYVSAGMDESLIPFAMDSGGNLFGFRRVTVESRSDDAPVIFFDHDYCEVRPEAESFDSWIEKFLRLKA